MKTAYRDESNKRRLDEDNMFSWNVAVPDIRDMIGFIE